MDNYIAPENYAEWAFYLLGEIDDPLDDPYYWDTHMYDEYGYFGIDMELDLGVDDEY